MGDLSDINSLISTLMMFLSGSKVSDTQINRSIVKEQILQLDPEMHLLLSGKSRFCNCNLVGLRIRGGSAPVNELSYFPGQCSGASFPFFRQGESWKGLMVRDISLNRVLKFSDGYIGDLSISLKSPPPLNETYLKKYPIIFNAKEEEGDLVYTCDPLINQVHAGKEELCTLLDSSTVKCMGFNGQDLIGDEPRETGDQLKKVPFTEGDIVGMFHAGKTFEEVFCVQLKNHDTECRHARSNKSLPLYGNPDKLRIRELHQNHTIESDIDYDKIEKFDAIPGAAVDLSEVNRTPIGEYLNRENTFLALYEDGSLGVLSSEDKHHQALFLPAGVKAKQIISYNVSSSCILSETDEIYCWGLIGGVITTNPINFSANKSEKSEDKNGKEDEKVKLTLFATPLKAPSTKNRAQWMGKVEFKGSAKVKMIKSHFLSGGFAAIPSICAILSDKTFTCFPQVLNEEGTQIGQMTEFPEIGKKIGNQKVKNFWLWSHLQTPGQRDPLPVVLLENNDLVFASGGSFVDKWPLRNVNTYEVMDVKADNTTVNVLFQNGELVAFPAAQAFSGSPFIDDDFNIPSLDSEVRHFKYDFGGPVIAIFPMERKPTYFSGVLCALLEKGDLKCSGTNWGYGDGKFRLNKDPQWRGKKFPEINFGKI